MGFIISWVAVMRHIYCGYDLMDKGVSSLCFSPLQLSCGSLCNDGITLSPAARVDCATAITSGLFPVSCLSVIRPFFFSCPDLCESACSPDLVLRFLVVVPGWIYIFWMDSPCMTYYWLTGSRESS